MNKVVLNVPPYGDLEVETSYQNNYFTVDGKGKKNIGAANLHFEPGKGWCCGWNYVNGNNVGPLSKDACERIGKAILDVPEFREKLKKWKKDAVKRLRVSVPRLKQEYEGSAARLAAFDDMKEF